MSTIRRWIIYAEYFDGKRELLNEFPFVGDFEEVTEEADRLIAELSGVESIEYESLGVVSGAMTLAAGAGGMEER